MGFTPSRLPKKAADGGDLLEARIYGVPVGKTISQMGIILGRDSLLTRDNGTVYTSQTTDFVVEAPAGVDNTNNYVTLVGCSYRTTVPHINSQMWSRPYFVVDGETYYGLPHTVGPRLVDLGLPSGVKWVDMNLGADDEKAFGDNYRWGEIAPNLTGAYSVPADRTYIGGTGYDAAHTRLGCDYRLPSIANIQELIDECNWQWEVNGFRISSKKNSNSIFLPVGSEGHYWSSQQGEAAAGNANMLEMSTTNRRLAEAVRSTGLMLRPTWNPKSDMNGEGGNAGSGENGGDDVEGNE